MKKLLFIAVLLMMISGTAQEVSPLYENVEGMVKVTNYYEDGSVKEEGFYKNKVITGTWITYDKFGNKTAVGNYKNAKKVGKWFISTQEGLKEVDYKNNVIANVQSWTGNMNVAVK